MASEYRGLGLNGGKYIADTSAHTGNFFCIVATEDTVIDSITSNVENLSNITASQDNTTLAANTAIYGGITGITLSSGAVIAYNV
jgi:uncharacterized membrane protein